MSAGQFLNPKSVHKPVGTYSHAVLVKDGQLLVIAGQVPIDKKGDIVGRGDFRKQARQVFKNMEAILRDAGGDLSDVIKLNFYVTDMRDRDTLREVLGEFFGTDYPPATLVGVTSLAHREFLVEIEALALVKKVKGRTG